MRMSGWIFAAALAFALDAHATGEREGAPPLFAAASAVDEARLEKLRGRLPAPRQLQQVGVVLWDEPRPGVPPARAGEPREQPQLNVSVTLR